MVSSYAFPDVGCLPAPADNVAIASRSLLPAGTQIVYVEAHDKVCSWNQQRIRVDLQQAKGDGFEVKP